MSKCIFFDLDEVTFDFVGGFCELYGYDRRNVNAWDMPNCLGISENEFFIKLNLCNHKFWSTLKTIPEGQELVRWANSKKSWNIYFVSSPTHNPESWSGKKQAVKSRFPELQDKLILCHDKYLLARKSETLLIDDKQNNIDLFRYWGGEAEAFPRPWNENAHLSMKEGIDKIKNKILDL